MLRRALFRVPFFVLISYGLLYFSYKYYVPEFGGNDFYQYYQMYLKPLHYDVAELPWVYRQLTALVVNFVWKLGIFYDTAIAFSREGYDKRIFFAAIFTNYMALTIAALVVTYSTDTLLAKSDELRSLLAGVLCFFGFFVQQGVLTGLTEGISWLLVAIGFFGYVSRSLIAICVVLCLSVIQRETIPFVFCVFGAVGLAFHQRERGFDAAVIICSVASFLAYVFIRTALIPVPGNEDQLSPLAILSSLETWRAKITADFIFQALLSQNMLVLLAAVCAALAISRVFGKKHYFHQVPTSEISVFISAFVLTAIGFGAGVEVNNIGRIISILTPVAAPLLTVTLASLFTRPD